MDPDKIILIYLTVPALVFILMLIAIELNLFRMVIMILLAAIAELFERLERKYEKAAEEIKRF